MLAIIFIEQAFQSEEGFGFWFVCLFFFFSVDAEAFLQLAMKDIKFRGLKAELIFMQI